MQEGRAVPSQEEGFSDQELSAEKVRAGEEVPTQAEKAGVQAEETKKVSTKEEEVQKDEGGNDPGEEKVLAREGLSSEKVQTQGEEVLESWGFWGGGIN